MTSGHTRMQNEVLVLLGLVVVLVAGNAYAPSGGLDTPAYKPINNYGSGSYGGPPKFYQPVAPPQSPSYGGSYGGKPQYGGSSGGYGLNQQYDNVEPKPHYGGGGQGGGYGVKSQYDQGGNDWSNKGNQWSQGSSDSKTWDQSAGSQQPWDNKQWSQSAQNSAPE